MLVALPAVAATPQAVKDRQVIAFFKTHPKLARTPAGQIALLKIEVRRLGARVRSLQSARLPETNDWLTAVRIVQRVYPGSADWMISCSASEGGHGEFVMNREGSGAAGWAQFLPGTFWRMYLAARADAESRGFKIPASTAAITSPLGQALAMAWGYTNGRRGEWFGAGC